MTHTCNQEVQRFDDICRCDGDLLDQGLMDEDENFDEYGSCPVCRSRMVVPGEEEDDDEVSP